MKTCLKVSVIILVVLTSSINSFAQGMSTKFQLATDANTIYLLGEDVKTNLVKTGWNITAPLSAGKTYIIRFSDSEKNNVRFNCNGVALEGNFTEMSITPDEDMRLTLSAHSKEKKSKFSFAILLKQ